MPSRFTLVHSMPILLGGTGRRHLGRHVQWQEKLQEQLDELLIPRDHLHNLLDSLGTVCSLTFLVNSDSVWAKCFLAVLCKGFLTPLGYTIENKSPSLDCACTGQPRQGSHQANNLWI